MCLLGTFVPGSGRVGVGVSGWEGGRDYSFIQNML